ncbi:S-layer homology domain-containing protein [Bifidobacterium rousetti]|uniref:S-layer homology domain-containing protein n=1 Tax=Bifidobacterium rousetti TaxID=2045439 RepID=UPI00168B1E66|nr:S-layer homology domain-containing protein [Bifidobacterium rousetti]
MKNIVPFYEYYSGPNMDKIYHFDGFDYRNPGPWYMPDGDTHAGIQSGIPAGWSQKLYSDGDVHVDIIAPDGTKIITYTFKVKEEHVDQNGIQAKVNGVNWSGWSESTTSYDLRGQYPNGARLSFTNLPAGVIVQAFNSTYNGAPTTLVRFVQNGVVSKDYNFLGATYMPYVDPVSGFMDVNDATPHVEDIRWLKTQGITTGFPDDSFQGMGVVVRQDMAAFLYRLAGSPAYTPDWSRNPFTDVTSSSPHAKEVLWLASTGISTGFPNHTFRGGDPVVRQDMAAFLHRYAIWRGLHGAVGMGWPFTDVDRLTPHADDIRWLAANGITTGFSDRTFRGMDVVVRQDMAAFLHRVDRLSA